MSMSNTVCLPDIENTHRELLVDTAKALYKKRTISISATDARAQNKVDCHDNDMFLKSGICNISQIKFSLSERRIIASNSC